MFFSFQWCSLDFQVNLHCTVGKSTSQPFSTMPRKILGRQYDETSPSNLSTSIKKKMLKDFFFCCLWVPVCLVFTFGMTVKLAATTLVHAIHDNNMEKANFKINFSLPNHMDLNDLACFNFKVIPGSRWWHGGCFWLMFQFGQVVIRVWATYFWVTKWCYQYEHNVVLKSYTILN